MFLRKLFKRKRKNADDNYAICKVINCVVDKYDNVIILFDFSSNYLEDALEIASLFKNSSKYISSSIDEEITLKDGSTDYIIHPKHYLLLGGPQSSFINLFFEIDNINNNLLNLLKDEIINYFDPSEVEKYKWTQDLFDINKFKRCTINNCIKQFDDYILDDLVAIIDGCVNINQVLSNLPSAFKSYDLINFISIFMDVDYGANKKKYITNEQLVKILKDNDVLKDFSINCNESEILKIINTPVYQREEYDDFFSGNIDDEYISELFREPIDRINNPTFDSNVEYEDIDEILNEELLEEDEINE